MEYNKSSKFGAKNHEFVMRYIKQSWDQKYGKDALPAYEYDEVTGLVNINGNFNCARKKLKDLRGIRFGIIRGSFNCSQNLFINMEGFPIEVRGNFDCSNNRIVSLIGAPKIVTGDFDVNGNNLKSLKGCTEVIGEDFHCSRNELESLEFGPRKIGGSYYCDYNKIKNLVGAPKKIKMFFDCSLNELTSLEGAPSVVGATFDCSSNNLVSLVGGPISAKNFNFSSNKVTSFEGLPTKSKNMCVDADSNGLEIKHLEGLPANVKELSFYDNDIFLDMNIVSDFISYFLKNRSLEITIAKFKDTIIQNAEKKKESTLDEMEEIKQNIQDELEKIKDLKIALVVAQENYKKINELGVEKYIDSLVPKEIQKGTGLLNRFGLLDD